jgi:4-hydroxy-3-polyprenylbenzoate decarboxylase
MAFEAFRDFVSQLDRSGELKRIAHPVATELEITEIADREMKSPNGGKALLFALAGAGKTLLDKPS